MKNTNQATFKHSYRSMFIWFLCTYLIFGPILTMLRDFNLDSFMMSNILEYSASDLLAKFNSRFSYVMFMFFAYISFYLFYPKKKGWLVIGLLLTLFLPIAIRFVLDQHLMYVLFGETNYRPDITLKFYFSDNTYFAVFYIPSGILYYFHQRNLALQAARLEAEQLRAEAEITHLRSQVNPHFLFNSLNNIYSLAYDKSDKILGAIEGLSELLRYALYEKSKFVPFSKEWDKAQQLIKIEQMRLLNPVDFDVQIADEVMDISIPPIVLLPLIENAFKHGDVQDEKHPPSIKASIENVHVVFQIENKIAPTQQKDDQHGIGMVNIKKRLDHIYGDEASFEVLEKEDTFMAQLSIPIQ